MVEIKPCPDCGSTDVDTSGSEAVCTGCGRVVGGCTLVSEVEFEEGAGGHNSAVGQFVGPGGGGGRLTGQGFRFSLDRRSKEATLKLARNHIRIMAGVLQINNHCQEIALNFYKMALMRNLTSGTERFQVVAVCLYITCRLEGTSHLLMDFSDALKLPVHTLGSHYLRISRALNVKVPASDPTMYILRFVHALNYGEKSHDINMTAARLMKRMKSDWINVGRRPSGLCAAAIFIAGKVHQDERTIEEIVKVVRIHHTTMKKRLKEFGDTAAAGLTLAEFKSSSSKMDELPEELPPIVKHQLAAELNEIGEDGEPVDKSPTLMAEQMELAYKEISRMLNYKDGDNNKKGKQQMAPAMEEGSSSSSVENEADMSIWTKFVHDLEGVTEMENKDVMAFLFNEDSFGIKGKSEAIQDLKEEETGLGPDLKLFGIGGKSQQANSVGTSSATTSTMGSGENVEAGTENGEIPLEGIDDAELEAYILNEEEVRMKTMLWVKLNAEYFREQKVKQEMEEQGLIPPKKQSKPKNAGKNKRKRNPTMGDDNPEEGISRMLAEKRLNSKINYDVLKTLLNGDDADMKPSEASTSFKQPQDEEIKVEQRAKKPAAVAANRSKGKKERGPVPKKVKEEIKKEVKEEPAVPVEEDVKILPEEPELKVDYYEEEEEDDEEELGAGALLKQFGGHDEEEFAYDEDY